MEKISVIVPAYNREKYLEKCVDSIIQQTYANLEIIIINDGSIDSTSKIIEQLRVKQPSIRVLHKKHNEGIGAARNSGIDMATGEYIVFVDSDDWIDPNHIADLYDLLQRTNSDVTVANLTKYNEQTGKYVIHITENDYYEKVYTPQEWFHFQYGAPSYLSTCFTVPWGKLYKKSLFDTILYPTDGFGEDDATTWKTYVMSNKIAYMHRASYVYRENDNSMTQVADMSTVFSAKPISERLEVLSLIGFDVSKEIAAYKWRANMNRDSYLNKGDIAKYKQLAFRLKLMEKYGK